MLPCKFSESFMKARSKPKLRVHLFFAVFFSQEGDLMRGGVTRSLPLQLQSRSSRTAQPPGLVFSLASLGMCRASVCQETGAQNAGGT